MSPRSQRALAAILGAAGLDTPGLRRLVRPAVAGPLLGEFKLGPILPTAGPPRLYLSWAGEKAAWLRRVRVAFPGEAVDRFLAEVPAGCRRMVDTDGERAELYLDDLHQTGAAEICRVLGWPGLERSVIVPAAALPGALEPLLGPFVARGGMLAERVGPGGPRALWVSEARWRETLGEARAVLEREHGLPPRYAAVEAAAAAHGFRAYIDGIDAHDGVLDVSLAFVDEGG
jgi:hypothetical protein